MKKLSQVSWSPGQDLKQSYHEYKAGVLTTRSRRSVIFNLKCAFMKVKNSGGFQCNGSFTFRSALS
jgi:hypothetical protein